MDELDELDVQILADLGSPSAPQWNVRTSFADLARRLGVDEETVRLRVKRARERGYMPPWRIRVNPHLLGHRPAGIDLEVGSAIPKSRAVAQLRLVEGVVLIVDYRGSGLMVLLWYPTEEALDRSRRLVESICGAPSRAVWKGVLPEPGLQLRPVDWRILNVMKDDARMDLKEVAAALGVTLRTVQRRLRAMTEGRAIMLEGTPDVPKVGGVICDYLVHCPDPDAKRAADGLVPFTLQRIGATDTSPEDYSIIGVSCANPAQADEAHAKLKALYAVDQVRMGIVREFVPVTEWLAEQIRARARRTSPTGPRRVARATPRPSAEGRGRMRSARPRALEGRRRGP